MARYTEAVCKLCRREGEKLFLKGDKCYSQKCPVTIRAYAPGQHGQARNKKMSEYGLQLRTKQRARRFYGVLESQFEHYYEMAERKQGITGENLLRFLESRLDNVIYRLGWANSRAQARQMVVHGHITINGKKCDIPSYLTRIGEVIGMKQKSRENEKIKEVLSNNAARPVVKWLDRDSDKVEAKIIALPERSDIDVPVEEHLIVEFYSK